MAIFSKLITTQNGRALIARMLAAEEKISFTKVRSSDAVYTLEELESLEELGSIKQTSEVSKVTRTNPTTVKVETVFTNTELTEGYNMRTVALYAQDGNGGELLYAAAVETSGNCFIPAFGGVTVSGAYIQLITTVSNAENVTLEVDNSVFATIGDIRELQRQIDSVSGLVGGMAAAINTSAKRLELMERIGSNLCEFRMTGGKYYKDSGPLTSASPSSLNNVTYYLYILTGNIVITELESETDMYEGMIYTTLYIGSDTFSQFLQICKGHPHTLMTTPVNIVAISGPPSIDGIRFHAQPMIYKKDESGSLSLIKDENYRMSMEGNSRLKIYKLGGVLASVSGTGFVEEIEEINNYNLLKNKPSINNVTLQGNLTTEQLGIEVGSGVTEEITYEKALAILNGEEEVSES